MAPQTTCTCSQADCRTCNARARKQLQRERDRVIAELERTALKTVKTVKT